MDGHYGNRKPRRHGQGPGNRKYKPKITLPSNDKAMLLYHHLPPQEQPKWTASYIEELFQSQKLPSGLSSLWSEILKGHDDRSLRDYFVQVVKHGYQPAFDTSHFMIRHPGGSTPQSGEQTDNRNSGGKPQPKSGRQSDNGGGRNAAGKQPSMEGWNNGDGFDKGPDRLKRSAESGMPACRTNTSASGPNTAPGSYTGNQATKGRGQMLADRLKKEKRPTRPVYETPIRRMLSKESDDQPDGWDQQEEWDKGGGHPIDGEGASYNLRANNPELQTGWQFDANSGGGYSKPDECNQDYDGYANELDSTDEGSLKRFPSQEFDEDNIDSYEDARVGNSKEIEHYLPPPIDTKDTQQNLVSKMYSRSEEVDQCYRPPTPVDMENDAHLMLNVDSSCLTNRTLSAEDSSQYLPPPIDGAESCVILPQASGYSNDNSSYMPPPPCESEATFQNVNNQIGSKIPQDTGNFLTLDQKSEVQNRSELGYQHENSSHLSSKQENSSNWSNLQEEMVTTNTTKDVELSKSVDQRPSQTKIGVGFCKRAESNTPPPDSYYVPPPPSEQENNMFPLPTPGMPQTLRKSVQEKLLNEKQQTETVFEKNDHLVAKQPVEELHFTQSSACHRGQVSAAEYGMQPNNVGQLSDAGLQSLISQVPQEQFFNPALANSLESVENYILNSKDQPNPAQYNDNAIGQTTPGTWSTADSGFEAVASVSEMQSQLAPGGYPSQSLGGYPSQPPGGYPSSQLPGGYPGSYINQPMMAPESYWKQDVIPDTIQANQPVEISPVGNYLKQANTQWYQTVENSTTSGSYRTISNMPEAYTNVGNNALNLQGYQPMPAQNMPGVFIQGKQSHLAMPRVIGGTYAPNVTAFNVVGMNQVPVMSNQSPILGQQMDIHGVVQLHSRENTPFSGVPSRETTPFTGVPGIETTPYTGVPSRETTPFTGVPSRETTPFVETVPAVFSSSQTIGTSSGNPGGHFDANRSRETTPQKAPRALVGRNSKEDQITLNSTGDQMSCYNQQNVTITEATRQLFQPNQMPYLNQQNQNVQGLDYQNMNIEIQPKVANWGDEMTVQSQIDTASSSGITASGNWGELGDKQSNIDSGTGNWMQNDTNTQTQSSEMNKMSNPPSDTATSGWGQPEGNLTEHQTGTVGWGKPDDNITTHTTGTSNWGQPESNTSAINAGSSAWGHSQSNTSSEKTETGIWGQPQNKKQRNTNDDDRSQLPNNKRGQDNSPRSNENSSMNTAKLQPTQDFSLPQAKLPVNFDLSKPPPNFSGSTNLHHLNQPMKVDLRSVNQPMKVDLKTSLNQPMKIDLTTNLNLPMKVGLTTSFKQPIRVDLTKPPPCLSGSERSTPEKSFTKNSSLKSNLTTENILKGQIDLSKPPPSFNIGTSPPAGSVFNKQKVDPRLIASSPIDLSKLPLNVDLSKPPPLLAGGSVTRNQTGKVSPSMIKQPMPLTQNQTNKSMSSNQNLSQRDSRRVEKNVSVRGTHVNVTRTIENKQHLPQKRNINPLAAKILRDLPTNKDSNIQQQLNAISNPRGNQGNLSSAGIGRGQQALMEVKGVGGMPPAQSIRTAHAGNPGAKMNSSGASIPGANVKVEDLLDRGLEFRSKSDRRKKTSKTPETDGVYDPATGVTVYGGPDDANDITTNGKKHVRFDSKEEMESQTTPDPKNIEELLSLASEFKSPKPKSPGSYPGEKGSKSSAEKSPRGPGSYPVEGARDSMKLKDQIRILQRESQPIQSQVRSKRPPTKLVWHKPDNIGQFFVNRVYLDKKKTRVWQPDTIKGKHTKVLSFDDVVTFDDLKTAVVVNSKWIMGALEYVVKFPATVDLTVICPQPWKEYKAYMRMMRRKSGNTSYDTRQPAIYRDVMVCQQHWESMVAGPTEEVCHTSCHLADCPGVKKVKVIHPYNSINVNANFFILRYPSRLRVLMFSGPLDRASWEHVAQLGWFMDFPITIEEKDENEAAKPRHLLHSAGYRFSQELQCLLEEMNYRTAQGRTDLFANVNFEGLSPFVQIITAAPSNPIKESECHFGLPKLCRLRGGIFWQKHLEFKRVVQTCKMGTGNGMSLLQNLLDIKHKLYSKPPQPNLQVIYPSKSFIETCLEKNCAVEEAKVKYMFSNNDKFCISDQYLTDYREHIISHSNVLLMYQDIPNTQKTMKPSSSPKTVNNAAITQKSSPKTDDGAANTEISEGTDCTDDAAGIKSAPKDNDVTKTDCIESDGTAKTETTQDSDSTKTDFVENDATAPKTTEDSDVTKTDCAENDGTAPKTTQDSDSTKTDFVENDGTAPKTTEDSDLTKTDCVENDGATPKTTEDSDLTKTDCVENDGATPKTTEVSTETNSAKSDGTAKVETTQDSESTKTDCAESNGTANNLPDSNSTEISAKDEEGAAITTQDSPAVEPKYRRFGFLFTGSQTVGYGSWGGQKNNQGYPTGGYSFSRYELGVGLFPYTSETNEQHAIDLSEIGLQVDLSGHNLVDYNRKNKPYTPVMPWVKPFKMFFRCLGVVTRELAHNRDVKFADGFHDTHPFIQFTDFDPFPKDVHGTAGPSNQMFKSVMIQNRSRLLPLSLGNVVDMVCYYGDRGLKTELKDVVHVFKDKQSAAVHYGIQAEYKLYQESRDLDRNVRNDEQWDELRPRKVLAKKKTETFEEKMTKMGLSTDEALDKYMEENCSVFKITDFYNQMLPELDENGPKIECRVTSIPSDMQWLEGHVFERCYSKMPRRLTGPFNVDLLQLQVEGHRAKCVTGIDC